MASKGYAIRMRLRSGGILVPLTDIIACSDYASLTDAIRAAHAVAKDHPWAQTVVWDALYGREVTSFGRSFS